MRELPSGDADATVPNIVLEDSTCLSGLTVNHIRVSIATTKFNKLTQVVSSTQAVLSVPIDHISHRLGRGVESC